VDEMCRDIKSVQMQLARVKQREVALQAHSQRLLVELEEAQAVAARASQDAVKASEDIAAQCARAAQLAAQVGVLEQDDLAGKNLLSRVSHQYEAEKKDREAAQARLDHQQVARAQAEARLEEECERMRSLEVVLEAHKQQRDSDAAALQGLELLLVEQKEQLKRLQEEREHLMSSQNALKKDADAMRKEVHTFMHRQTAQQQEVEHALHAQVESLQLACVRLDDCVTEARSKAHQHCLEQAGERSKMMAQMWGLLNELTGHQETHETLRAEKKRAEEERASAVEKLDAARAEMEADAMSRMNEVALIKHLRVRLESTGVQLEETQEQLRL